MIIVSDRKLLIPSGEKHIGYVGDNMVEERVFALSNNKIFDLDFRIDLANTGETAILQKRLSSDGKLLFLSWSITAAVLKNTPAVEFQLRGFEAEGNRTWHSERNVFYTDESIDASKELTEEEIDEFHEIEKIVAHYRNEVEAFVNESKENSSETLKLRNEAQSFRDEAQELAQKAFADYSELKNGVYTKAETDELLSDKADKEKTETDIGMLNFKLLGLPTFNDVYTKGEADEKEAVLVSQLESVMNELVVSLNEMYYTKHEVDSKIGDIDSALDELHGYAASLIGGGA